MTVENDGVFICCSDGNSNAGPIPVSSDIKEILNKLVEVTKRPDFNLDTRESLTQTF